MATASAGTLSVTLTANDRLSPALTRVNALATKMQAGLSRMGSIGGLGGAGGLNRLANSARGASRGLEAMIPALGVLTAAGTVAGVVRLVTGFADMGAQLGRAAYRVQTTASGLAALQGAARIAGSSAQDLTAGLQGLGDALSDAVGGRDATALQYFTLLGIKMRDATGHARTASDVLPEVADGIARIADPRLQARVLGALRIPESLIPFMKRGAAGLAEYASEARRLGAITDDGAASAARFEKQQSMLRLAGEGLVNTIAQRLAPSIGGLMERMTEWIAKNREWLAQKVEAVVTAVAGAVEQLATRIKAWVDDGGWDRFSSRIQAIGEGIEKVVQSMGGWENAIIVVGGLLAANMVAPLASIVGSLGVIAAFRAPAWLLGMVGVTGLGAAGAFALGMKPSTTNAGEREELERQRSDPAALAREMEPARVWSRQASLLDRMLNFPAERIIGRIATGPAAGFANRAGREAQRSVDVGPAPTDLLGLIGRSEGTDRGRGYNETLGYGAYTGGARNLTGMTLEEVDKMQSEMLRHPDNKLNSSAAGRYQITQTTLRGLVREMGLDPRTTRYDEATQDKLATALAERRGLRAFQAGNITREEFQSRLAQEWASIPDPRTGQGFYPGQRRPGVSQSMVDGVLGAVRERPNAAPSPASSPAPAARYADPLDPRSLPALPERPTAGRPGRGEEPMQNPSLGPQAQRVDVRVQLAGPGSAGATVTTRTQDGSVRVERTGLGGLG
ncbi:hypothetical protein [Roseomonas indoligenes]|uniref:Phage tail lysozyme domain-containing protein n=1 Tax=Roseomonas indoligenes TaxID=2820811 RepID=A0A940MWA5_9PROT|nr:hypothetical protein [Pararoseomonas indoligenes]MBP0492165.1 hypothetical protein [Pararoseomonas indoligenes]